MMKLYIVRHAESEGNATGNYSTAIADSLSASGRKEAEALADSLTAWAFDTIIVSPRLRALQTIAPYLVATGQQAEIWPEIAEACWHEEREEPAGTWPRQAASLPAFAPGHFCFRDGEPIAPADVESFGEGLCRIHTALHLIQEAFIPDQESVLVVTHGHVIREILNLMLATRELDPFHHENCGLTCLSYKGCWTLEFCNRKIIGH
ncbi:MAG: histidine phosphatase family protein [Lentisphaeria bacterium]|nr:histidine phosphatase family protein [Lentisphaeria bacterium]